MSEQPHAKQSPWKTPKSRIFWPMVAGAVVLWTVVAVLVFSTVYDGGAGRGLTRLLLVGLGALLVFGVRYTEGMQRQKEARSASQMGSPLPQGGPSPQAGYGPAAAYGQSSAGTGYGQPAQTHGQPPTSYGQGGPGYGQGGPGYGQQP
ncbi:hypothetical protein J5X07_01595 [Actinomyces bowdenii]|uniref:Uncharacterized protein n=1 Tax=Actinomyces bowdenii TaxID=131109 RepID=A0A3P1VAV3_9ACTO|nr:hypothetical protein [Actinomyces bowdenii]MBO3723737.1 hypothetical protein [Actinomyces bowdenii]RRD30797.1 hypothetical protein EII10_01445 [Actinomyces bowdenii]